MALPNNIFCCGVDPYNFTATDEVVVTIPMNVGQSTSIGPKVAIRKNRPFEKGMVKVGTSIQSGEPIIGTIDGSIYRKNSFQDNSKYIIRKTKRKMPMEKASPVEIIENAIGKGKDVVLNEPAVIAFDRDTRNVLAVGEDARRMLGEITGEDATESVIDAVFQNFCVGK